MTSFEFPGFHVSGSPVFNGALGTTMFSGNQLDPTAVLDLGMVFGSRLWGHDVPDLVMGDLGAPGLGDLYTHDLRERACRALCEQVAREQFVDPAALRALVLHSGSEAVETAIKTALRATGRDRMIAFEGAYHGTFGLALAVTWRREFRSPWSAQYRRQTTFVPWGSVPIIDNFVGCVVVEPWQGRAGVIPPPVGFLEELRDECDRAGALLILDAVLCGSGRTGALLVESIERAQPDLVCLGKALGCGLTASAVVARADVTEAAWARGPVEPAHTSTSLGDPVACAGILRTLVRLERRGEEIESAAAEWRQSLRRLARHTGLKLRGTGLVWALDTGRAGGGTVLAQRLLDEHRIIVVPSSANGSSITIYPAVTGTEFERERLVDAVVDSLDSA